MSTNFKKIPNSEYLRLLAFENDHKAADLIMGCVGGDNVYPSDDCYKQPDGDYNISDGAYEICRRNGLNLITSEGK